ncbi:ABC drug exporter AbcA [Protomyces lactucae-debilis]|uniref:ABC drug exporter AbcA n=1 Tax=Protomyces lactucae-debilis TaxID=2754530 RepID=A0A1Y2FIG0_PROLT|nr:ABC drug exporter AbcA [Protomyces lactucae-debilis]ORY83752.1 ABC drug exporter AbcA [Protomyces lactucae-debilis]
MTALFPSGVSTVLDKEQSDQSISSAEASEQRSRDVADLAKTFTKDSHLTVNGATPFDYAPNSPLDPNGDCFNARAWVKAMYAMQQASNSETRSLGYSFDNLSAYGYGSDTDFQKTVSTVVFEAVNVLKRIVGIKGNRVQILRNLDGVVHAGEMLVVLGPPGAGCTTFLKTLTGETHGFQVDADSHINYQGISYKDMSTRYRGEASYTAEVDVHFPNLTVGETLFFAAKARAPRVTPGGLARDKWAIGMRDVMMATLGISHTVNTKVGNDFIRGVSGGERKRVTIAEAALSRATIQAWDNSTRGLDSANAIEFCKTLRLQADYFGITPSVAIYQSPQAAFDVFDKVLVLYEGRQIYFGRTTDAQAYFERLGFECPARQTVPDFLTSMTSAQERRVRQGCSNVPETSDDFAAAWKASPEYQQVTKEIAVFNKENPETGDSRRNFEASRRLEKAKGQRIKSPYTLSYGEQVRLCLWRGFRRLFAEPGLTIFQIVANAIFSLIIASVFFDLQPSTVDFFNRGSLLFFSVLMNALSSSLEVLLLYAQRDIVEKHARYAFYHPSAEAFASILTDMPYKICNSFIINIILYFMTNLRREPGAFFFFVLVSFLLTIATSQLFRTLASFSKSLSQALVPTAIINLAMVMFVGFVIPVIDMLGWSRWISYINPVAYGFESLMINEFHGRNFDCSAYVPSYGNLASGSQICSTVGSIAGQSFVEGERFLNESYGYKHENKWRNVYIIFAFAIFFSFTYLIGVELVQAAKSKGEVLVFKRNHKRKGDLEVGRVNKTQSHVPETIQRQTAIFHWQDVCYDIQIKKETRHILDHVDGWVKPGTRTALMGVSGAGKTTLLDVLASRVTMGVIDGKILVDGQPRDDSFQRKTGYAQQQDIHLDTSTVREALIFSALLRQPAHIPRKDKIAYVDEVIDLLDMTQYADAVVGVPGEGLNVEQRKRLTIGVELAAKPALLLFLDEPTSGLDSQTSWAICDLLEKLTTAGQAILCTVHQPSAMLFQRFDRLLFLAKGGQTVYFGDVGENSKTLVQYFERNGAHPCPQEANPAEWMLEVIGAAPGSHTDQDWHKVWRASPEYEQVQAELEDLEHNSHPIISKDASQYNEFAAPLRTQIIEVTRRVFQQYWRSPTYLYSKLALCSLAVLFVGFVFYKAPNTQQGMQSQLFSIFLVFTVFPQLVNQIMPHFVTQRTMYEARERPSKAYSWKAFMLANIGVELPWNTLMAVVVFFCLYYPVGFYTNATYTNTVHIRGFEFFLFTWQFMMFVSTFASLIIAFAPDASVGGNLAQLLFALCLIFCGVLASPDVLPRFWIFMYYCSPFTYLVSGMISAGLADAPVRCASREVLRFNAPSGQTCGEYMAPWIASTGGYLFDSATSTCEYCQLGQTNQFLAAVSIEPSSGRRWRNFGILFIFLIFNIFAATLFYWLARVPKKTKKVRREEKARKLELQAQAGKTQ